MSLAPLSDIQRWMMTVITDVNGLDHGLHLAQENFALNEQQIVSQISTIEPTTRLDIYAQGYLLRLLECIRADFPALHYVMGEELFTFFAKAYIGNFPSTSTTLFDLGAGFAEFIQNTQSSQIIKSQTETLALTLPLDLARLERARTEVIRAQGLEGQAMSASLEPMALLTGSDVHIKVAPCLRLVNLSFPLIDLLEAIDREDENPIIPEPQLSFVAITRIQYRVNMTAINPWQFFFLKAAKDAASVYSCAVISSQESGRALEHILADLLLWLPLAFSLGFLTHI